MAVRVAVRMWCEACQAASPEWVYGDGTTYCSQCAAQVCGRGRRYPISERPISAEVTILLARLGELGDAELRELACCALIAGERRGLIPWGCPRQRRSPDAEPAK